MTSEATEESGAEIEVASKTDVGQVRTANEDSCDIFERSDGARLLIVADGMGGHQGGATASQTAVAAISDAFSRDSSNDLEEMIESAITSANLRIFELAQNDSTLEGMGTTVVTFLLDARGRGTVAHVGDSRAYRYRQGQLDPLTVDHSVVAEMQSRGLLSADEAATHPRRNEILRSVGVQAEVKVDVAGVEVAAGDRFLLCSDGLTGVVTDDEIAAAVQTESTEGAVEKLIQLANDRGGPDNISVQILSIPTSQTEGDPEATAPVELSEIGIQAIETKRRERKRSRTLAIGLIAAGLALGLYFAWISLWPQLPPDRAIVAPPPRLPDAADRARTSALDDEAADPIESVPDPRFETQRRGIPR